MSTSTTTVSAALRTTSLSSTVIASQKCGVPLKPVKAEPVDDVLDLEGEDDTEEREAAIASPIKGNRRVTSNVSYKLEL